MIGRDSDNSETSEEKKISKPNGGFLMIVKCKKEETSREFGSLPSKMQMKLAMERRNRNILLKRESKKIF